MTTRWIIGLASGSSADGVDAALLEVTGWGLEMQVRLARALQQPYGPELQALIQQVSVAQACETRQVGLLHRLLGETFAAAARSIADQASLSLHKVQCIGCPGHTVWHETEGRFPSTLALGMAAVVAERCGVTTVHDFRARDLAVGGLGVPLAALTDYLLFRHAEENRVVLHLGGLARAVYLPAGARLMDILGFETGPCSVLLDALMRQLTSGRASFDAGGKYAVQGKCLEPLLRDWLRHPALQRRPPRCVPSQEFGDHFAAQILSQAHEHQAGPHDLLCTATHFVARCITQALERFLPRQQRIDRVLLSGGGARNGLLWQLLGQQLAGTVVQRSDEAGIPADVRKALSFGVLAALTLDGVPGNVPPATGAAGSRLLGSLTPGSHTNWAHCLAWMAARLMPSVDEDNEE
jgi:anhydro-N-acetylmuramic acid kinase